MKLVDIEPVIDDLNESVELYESLYGDMQGARIIRNIIKELEEAPDLSRSYKRRLCLGRRRQTSNNLIKK